MDARFKMKRRHLAMEGPKMHLSITIFMLMFLFINTFSFAEDGMHLFIFSGQSNMVRLDPKQSFRPVLEKALGKERVLVVKDASNGQPIRRWYRLWKDENGNKPKESCGDLYDRLLRKVSQSTRDKSILTVTFLWMQGERDAREKHGAVYADALRGLYRQLCADLGRNDICFVIGRLSDYDLKNENFPHWTLIREAQVEVADDSDQFMWISTDDLNDVYNENGEKVKDDLHYTSEGYKTFGIRLANAALRLHSLHTNASGKGGVMTKKRCTVCMLVARRIVATWLPPRALPPGGVREIRDRLGNDGRFNDLDYADRSSAGWHGGRHLYRFAQVAWVAVHGNAEQRGGVDAAELRTLALRILDGWIMQSAKSKSNNWWWNKIGMQKTVGPAALALRGDLDDRQRDYIVALLRRGTDLPPQLKKGQNLVWAMTTKIYAGLFADDEKMVRESFQRVWKEVAVDRPEGIRPDGSFFQHGRQMYNGGYGKNFACDLVLLAFWARGTDFALDREQVALLSDYLLEGMQYLERGGYISAMTCGRGITRKGNTDQRDAFLFMIRHASQIDPDRKAKYDAWANRLKGDPADPTLALHANKLFYMSDAMMHHRPTGSFSVRFVSKRNLGTESGNGEGLKNHYLGFGLLETRVRGDEYADIYPVWNWRRIPGIAIRQKQGEGFPLHPWGRSAKGNRAFVGGISDGSVGCLAQDFDREGIRLRQAAFGMDDGLVLLGAGLCFEEAESVWTTLEQCKRRGKVLGAKAGEPLQPVGETLVLPARKGARFWHAGILYEILEDGAGTIRVFSGPRTGTWRSINRMYDDTPVTIPVCEIALDHRRNAENGAYACRIVPGVDKEEAARRSRPTFTILANTRDLQAVCDGAKTIAVFYKPGRCPGTASNGESWIQVDSPCIVLWERTKKTMKLLVSDPTQSKQKVMLTLPGWWTGNHAEKLDTSKTVIHIACPSRGKNTEILLEL